MGTLKEAVACLDFMQHRSLQQSPEPKALTPDPYAQTSKRAVDDGELLAALHFAASSDARARTSAGTGAKKDAHEDDVHEGDQEGSQESDSLGAGGCQRWVPSSAQPCCPLY